MYMKRRKTQRRRVKRRRTMKKRGGIGWHWRDNKGGLEDAFNTMKSKSGYNNLKERFSKNRTNGYNHDLNNLTEDDLNHLTDDDINRLQISGPL